MMNIRRDIFLRLLSLVVLCGMIGLSGVVSAEVQLTIHGEIGTFTADFTALTLPGTSSSYDGYDLDAPTTPGNYSQFYSTMGGHSLALDVWDKTENPRTLYLVFTTSPLNSGTLSLSWSYASTDHNITLTDYGTDSTYTTAITSVNMEQTSSYSSSSNGARYMTIQVINTEGEETESESSGSGGGGGGAALAVLEDPITRNIGGAGLLGFTYENKPHSLILLGVRETEADIQVQSHPQRATLKVGDEMSFDITDDEVDDIAVTLIRTDLFQNRATFTIFPLNIRRDIVVRPRDLIVSAVVGREITRTLEVYNQGKRSYTLTLSFENLSGIVHADADIMLAAQERRTLALNISSMQPQIIVGSAVFRFKGFVVHTIPVLINPRSENVLFDASVEIPRRYQTLTKGTPLKTQLSLRDLTTREPLNISIRYLIKDFSGTTYYEESEERTIAAETSFVKEFSTHALPVGKYLAGVEIVYGGGFSTSSAPFEIVVDEKLSGVEIFLLLIGILGSIIIIVVGWALRRKHTLSSRRKLYRKI